MFLCCLCLYVPQYTLSVTSATLSCVLQSTQEICDLFPILHPVFPNAHSLPCFPSFFCGGLEVVGPHPRPLLLAKFFATSYGGRHVSASLSFWLLSLWRTDLQMFPLGYSTAGFLHGSPLLILGQPWSDFLYSLENSSQRPSGVKPFSSIWSPLLL